MLPLTVREETWSQVWPEAEQLALLHHSEVRETTPLVVDTETMFAMSKGGWLRIIAARLGPELIGYLTWQLSCSVESSGVLIAQQGAWFLLPGYPRVALQMFEESVEILKKAQVRFMYPHNRFSGRGDGLDKFFLRRGAKPLQMVYEMELS